MNKRKIFFFFCFFVGLIAVFFFKARPCSYFETVDIKQFTANGHPCIPVQFGDVDVLLELDSGFQGQFSLYQDVLKSLPLTFLNERTTCGIRGNLYKKNNYTTLQARIGHITFKTPQVEEALVEFDQDSLVSKGTNESIPIEMGRIGWSLFHPYNLLIDIPNRKIGISNSVETLQKHGYFKDRFIKTPLLENKYYIGIELISDNKPLRCCIDTGATLCVFNTNENGKELLKKQIQLADQDLGSYEFYPFPIQIPEAPDVILGMNFLSEHTIFIDFNKKCAYISM